MKAIKEIRRLNMIELLQSNYAVNQTHFAVDIGQQSSVISRSVNTQTIDHRGIGNKLARSIEQNLTLPIKLDG
jgi:hypothetical protein